jgi:hypothetical protein
MPDALYTIGYQGANSNRCSPRLPVPAFRSSSTRARRRCRVEWTSASEPSRRRSRGRASGMSPSGRWARRNRFGRLHPRIGPASPPAIASGYSSSGKSWSDSSPSSSPSASACSASSRTPPRAIARCWPMRSSVSWTYPPSICVRGGLTSPTITKVLGPMAAFASQSGRGVRELDQPAVDDGRLLAWPRWSSRRRCSVRRTSTGWFHCWDGVFPEVDELPSDSAQEDRDTAPGRRTCQERHDHERKRDERPEAVGEIAPGVRVALGRIGGRYR